jgi:hypothetical protein
VILQGRRLALAWVMAVGVAACGFGVVPPSPPGPPATPVSRATPASMPASVPPPTEGPTPTDVSQPPPSADAERPDPASFLQVCGDATPAAGEAIPCSDAIEAALTAPELAGARIVRVDLGGSCDPPRPCSRTSPGSVWVTVLSDRRPLLVEVVRAEDGGLAVGAVRRAARPEVPAFTPPPPGRADLPGAPASLLARPAYPLCGREDTPMGGPYDEPARTCFLTGVLAGSAVEFASAGQGTEGGPYARLYRYAGTGGIEFVTGEGGAWKRMFTGIGEAGDGLVFRVDGLSTRPEPVP